MIADGSLLPLCALAGVVPSFGDVWGNERHVSPETLRALLGAMGFEAATEQQVATSIAEFGHAQWQALLPPVITLVAGETANVPVALAEGGNGQTLHWLIDLEAGGRFEGSAAQDALTVLAERRDSR